MEKFQKVIAIDPLALTEWGRKEILSSCRSFQIYADLPRDNAEIIRRIGDADAVLLSSNARIDREVLLACPNLRYVGMCCSLYSEESANVDIPCARERGILVKGIRDYGDRGVVEYVLWQLVDLLHGYSREAFYGAPSEITGLKVGFVGFGTSGRMTADALQAFGAEIFYYARSRKENAEAGGMHDLPLHELLAQSDVIITCLNKNVILLREKEFQKIGSGKIMINTSIGPASDMEPLFRWIKDPRNIFCCDTRAALGPIADQALALPNVRCRYASAGMTRQAYDLLSKKVLDNMKAALRELS